MEDKANWLMLSSTHMKWCLQGSNEDDKKPEVEAPTDIDARFSQWESMFEGIRGDLMTNRRTLEDINSKVSRVETSYHGYDASFNQMDEVVNQLAFNVRNMMYAHREADDKIEEVHSLMARFEAHKMSWPNDPNE